MKIALVSLDQLWEDKEGNRAQCNSTSQRITREFPGIDLIIYPEMTLTGFSVANASIAEFSEGSETIEFFKKLAANTNCAHIFGMSGKNENEIHFNQSGCVNDEGKILSVYSKMHTFSFAGESDLYSRGELPADFEIKGAQLGLSICYDLRFAELYAYYRSNCNLVINIANWPASRKEHWLTLLRARAIENQYFVVGVNRTGVDGNDIEYEQSSVIFDPLGNSVTPIDCEETVSIFDLDLNDVAKVRDRFPFINDRRNNIYRNFIKD